MIRLCQVCNLSNPDNPSKCNSVEILISKINIGSTAKCRRHPRLTAALQTVANVRKEQISTANANIFYLFKIA